METDDEWELIKNEIQHRTTVNNSSNEWHIGLMKRNDTGKWTWVSEELLTIKRWQPKRPRRRGKVVAVIAKHYPDGHHGLFSDLRTDIHRGYICELIRGEQ